MRKFEIHLNDEKILADGKYTPEQVHNALDVAFESCGIAKDKDTFYVGQNDSDDVNRFHTMFFFLVNRKWFMDYVDKWIAYNDYQTENVLESIGKV